MRAALAVVCQLAFSGSPGLKYLVFPVLIWAALRFQAVGAAATSLFAAGVSVSFAADGVGPFAADTTGEGVLASQLFNAVTSLGGLMLAAVVSERATAVVGCGRPMPSSTTRCEISRWRTSAGIAAGNTREALIACWLLLRVARPRPSLDRVCDVLALTLAGALGTMVGATAGFTSPWLTVIVPAASCATPRARAGTGRPSGRLRMRRKLSRCRAV